MQIEKDAFFLILRFGDGYMGFRLFLPQCHFTHPTATIKIHRKTVSKYEDLEIEFEKIYKNNCYTNNNLSSVYDEITQVH